MSVLGDGLEGRGPTPPPGGHCSDRQYGICYTGNMLGSSPCRALSVLGVYACVSVERTEGREEEREEREGREEGGEGERARGGRVGWLDISCVLLLHKCVAGLCKNTLCSSRNTVREPLLQRVAVFPRSMWRETMSMSLVAMCVCRRARRGGGGHWLWTWSLETQAVSRSSRQGQPSWRLVFQASAEKWHHSGEEKSSQRSA